MSSTKKGVKLLLDISSVCEHVLSLLKDNGFPQSYKKNDLKNL